MLKLIIIFELILLNISACAQTNLPMQVKIMSNDLSYDDNLVINIKNHDTLDYWYHIKIEKMVDSLWIPCVPQGQQSFFKTGTIKKNATSKEKLNISSILEGMNPKIEHQLKVNILFTERGKHLSQNSLISSDEQMIIVTPTKK